MRLLLTVVTGLGVEARRPLRHLSVRLDPRLPSGACHETLHGLQQLLATTQLQLAAVSPQLQLARVRVELPRAWRNTACVRNLDISNSNSNSNNDEEADVVITETRDPAVRALQYGGCGVRGRRVILPLASLLGNVTGAANTTSTSFLRSLLKHEFGFFSTHGGAEDARFPELYRAGAEERENCNTDPVSDSSGYDGEAPTLHNLMCQEQSPLSLIQSALAEEEEEEEEDSIISPSPSAPVLEYSLTTSVRHVLVLDRSQQSRHVWKHLHNALHR